MGEMVRRILRREAHEWGIGVSCVDAFCWMLMFGIYIGHD